jgi:hypothetical protein
VRYNDPTGHCARNDQICKEILESVEEKFSVSIDDRTGLWTKKGLMAIQRGMGKLQSGIGSDAFAELFTGVTFEIGGNVDPNGMGTHGNRDIHVGINKVNSQTYIEQETVHELTHIWDNWCRDCMSKGLMGVTDGRYVNSVYKPGGIPPSDHALIGRGEDWAESVTAFLFPGYSKNPLSQERTDYVARALSLPLLNPLFIYGDPERR